MRIYMITGEASGDMHGASLIKALQVLQSDIQFRGWGGDRMEEAGCTLVKHYRDLAFMGFVEVVKNLPTILSNLKFCKSDIRDFQPDALILVDYPGFNLRMAKWAKQNQIPVLYYISPQIWAWHQSRVYGIKKSVDQMYVILPFEKDFYARYGMDVEYVGHPLIDEIDRFLAHHEGKPAGGKHIAVLPGSRKQEIKHILPAVSGVFADFPEYHFTIAATKHIPVEYYTQYLATASENFTIRQGETYAILAESTAAITASGTATLETALFNVPQIVCYKGNPVSYQIARKLVKVPYISLVNLVIDKPLIREIIQDALKAEQIRDALQAILSEQKRMEIRAGYRELREKLGDHGAAKRTARHIYAYLEHMRSEDQ